MVLKDECQSESLKTLQRSRTSLFQEAQAFEKESTASDLECWEANRTDLSGFVRFIAPILRLQREEKQLFQAQAAERDS